MRKEPFKKVNIDVAELKRNREIDALMENLNGKIHEEVEKLAQELVDAGYNVDEFEIVIDPEVMSPDGKYTVYLKVVQVGKILEYDLGGE